jgi:retron-type reverse transcriptase
MPNQVELLVNRNAAKAVKPEPAAWKNLPKTKKVKYLISKPTIADRVWTAEPRLEKESRSEFIRRVLA